MFIIKQSKTISLSESAWLAGFIDADGGFKIRCFRKKKTIRGVFYKKSLGLSFALEPKASLGVMKKIADFFEVRLTESIHSLTKYWLVEINSFSKLKILRAYLENYPLLSSKYNDFKDWCTIFDILLSSLTFETKQVRVLQIKERFNRNRTVFDWSHLMFQKV